MLSRHILYFCVEDVHVLTLTLMAAAAGKKISSRL